MELYYYLYTTSIGPIYHINRLERTEGYRLTQHAHPFWQAIIVTDGKLTVTTDSGKYVLGAGSFHILPPGCFHALQSDGYRQIGIDFAAGDSELTAIYSAFPVPTCQVSYKLSAYARQLEETDSSVPLADDIIRTLAMLLLQTAASAVLRSQEDPLKQRILDYIATHLDSGFALSDMAKSLHISGSHLERLSQKCFQCGIIALRNQKRCERALLLLAETDLPIQEISASLGFSEPSNFTAFFKRIVGISPTVYRQKYFNNDLFK